MWLQLHEFDMYLMTSIYMIFVLFIRMYDCLSACLKLVKLFDDIRDENGLKKDNQQ